MAQSTGLNDKSNMSDKDRERIHSEGGKASAKGNGAAGKTGAAAKGGRNSHSGQRANGSNS